MSRYYNMDVEVTGFNPDQAGEIQDALEGEWPFDLMVGTTSGQATIQGSGRGNLGGGMSEQEFALILARTVFEANQGPCTIILNATYLENIPYTTFRYGPEDYEDTMQDLPVPKEGNDNA